LAATGHVIIKRAKKHNVPPLRLRYRLLIFMTLGTFGECAAQAQNLADLFGKNIYEEIKRLHPSTNLRWTNPDKFIMGNDGKYNLGKKIERTSEGVTIKVKWANSDKWTECFVLHERTNCGDLFDITSDYQKDLDDGPELPMPSTWLLSLVSRVNGQRGTARLTQIKMTSCNLEANQSLLSGPDMGLGGPVNNNMGKRFPMTFNWRGTYAIENSSKTFILDYLYTGYTAWLPDNPVF